MKIAVIISVLIFCLCSTVNSRDLRTPTWLEDSYRPSMQSVVGDKQNRLQRESSKDQLSYFVKRVESLLSRLVPSQQLVQDLMGLPEPDSSSNDISREVSHIIRNAHKLKPKTYLPDSPYEQPLLQPTQPLRTPLLNVPMPFVPTPASHRAPLGHKMPTQELMRIPDRANLQPIRTTNSVRKPLPKVQPPPAENSKSVISKLPIMLHSFADDWFNKDN